MLLACSTTRYSTSALQNRQAGSSSARIIVAWWSGRCVTVECGTPSCPICQLASVVATGRRSPRMDSSNSTLRTKLERDQEFQKTEQDDEALRSSRFIVAAPTIEKRFCRHLPSNCGQTSRIDARDKKLCSDSAFGVRCLDATAVSTIHRQQSAEQNASKYPLP